MTTAREPARVRSDSSWTAGYRNHLPSFLAIELTFTEPGGGGEKDTDSHFWVRYCCFSSFLSTGPADQEQQHHGLTSAQQPASPGEVPLPLVQLFCKKRKVVSLHPVVQLRPSHQTPLAGPAGQNPPTQVVLLLSVKVSFKLD